MISNDRGFSLIELITVVAVMAIVAAIALPSFNSWLNSAVYRESAQNILQTLNQARSLAVSTNLEYRVDLEIANRRYRLLRGEQSSGSTFTTIDPVVNWTDIPSKVTLRRTVTCDNATDQSIVFNPNGTTEASGDICIMEASNPSNKRFQININQTSGRATIQ